MISVRKFVVLVIAAVCSLTCYSQTFSYSDLMDLPYYDAYLDSVCSEGNGPKIHIESEGYFVAYFYSEQDSLYNYNWLFVPKNSLSSVVVGNLLKLSKVFDYKVALRQTYYISVNNKQHFEDLFEFGMVLKHYRSNESKIKSLLENKLELEYYRQLLSESHQFFTDSFNADGIYYKIIPIEALIEVESYDSLSLICHHKKNYEWTSYLEEAKSIKVHFLRNVKLIKLDYRFISPMLGEIKQVILTEKWRIKGVQKELRYMEKQ